jgi:hypothetical protein
VGSLPFPLYSIFLYLGRIKGELREKSILIIKERDYLGRKGRNNLGLN